MSMTETVRLALQERSPALFRQLQQAGTLQAFVTERADEINQQIADMAMNSPQVRKAWSPDSNLPMMEQAAILNSQTAIARELVLSEMLEFPQDETSPPSRDATTPSAPAT
jgi:hypothetical protein